MDAVTSAFATAQEALLRDYYLWIAFFMISLAFGLYVYLMPNALEFFTNPDSRVRSEPTVKTGAE